MKKAGLNKARFFFIRYAAFFCRMAARAPYPAYKPMAMPLRTGYPLFTTMMPP
jgi:hypothetical protein